MANDTLAEVQGKLRSNSYKNIVFFVGAGISTAAGIPDFRSPGTGLYDNLEKLKLPYPEAVFDIDFFRRDPKPFYTLAKELYPGQFEPTKFHKLMKWCDDKGMLLRVYTQNIDTLERLAGVNGQKIVEAHGSFASNSCIKCKKMAGDIKKEVLKGKVPKCSCGGYIKPDIVFFGEGLPELFFESMEDDFDQPIDLAIIAGTSLQVQPFAQLPDLVPKGVPRLLFNDVKVGTIGSRKKDVFVKGRLEDIGDIFDFLQDDDTADSLASSLDAISLSAKAAQKVAKQAEKDAKEGIKEKKPEEEGAKQPKNSDLSEEINKLKLS